jgi:hypothetical protein
MDEQKKDEILKGKATLGQTAAVFLPTATIATVGIEALLHAPLPIEIAGLVGAYVAARNSPAIYRKLQEHVPALPEMAAKERKPGEYTLTDRLLGKHMRDGATTVLPDAVTEPLHQPIPRSKSNEDQDIAFDLDGEDDMPSPHGGSDMFLFSDVLRAGFTPSLDRMFLARTEQGQDLFCAVKEPYHVALAGNTGGGKSSIMRMLMLQLCHLRVRVLLLNPHYTRYDLENGEDWTPFEPYLVHPPMECRKYEVIEHYLRAAAKDLIPKRLEKRANSQPVGKPYFIVIDELPSIVREVENAPDYMRVILEEGRKVGVFLISAAQDFLVKTISPKAGGGSIRECYRTVYYVGGDPTTARTLLDTQRGDVIPEDELGKGTVMFRGVPSKKAAKVYVPYVDNESLYMLLGKSTYTPAKQQPEAPEQELARPDVARDSGHLRLVSSEAVEDDYHAKETERLPELAGQPTGRFSRSLSPELQKAYDAYQQGYTTSRTLAPVMNIGKTKAAELIGQLKARKLVG